MNRHLSSAVIAALCVPLLSAALPALAGTPAGDGHRPAPSVVGSIPELLAPEVAFDASAPSVALSIPELLAPEVSFDASAKAAAAIASGFAIAPPGEQPIAAGTFNGPVRSTDVYVSGTRYEAARYRPRRGHSSGLWRGRGVSQIHAGFLDPDGPSEAGFLAGLRGGQQIDDLLQIGLGVDWRNKSGRTTELLQRTVGPGGETIVVRRDVSRYASNLFPFLGYVQISGPSNLTLVPYVGAAVSWQVLFLQADDFTTGQTFEATFDGFGWQLWAGAALPLSGRSRLLGEVFVNRADLNRDVFDAATGQDIRETVNVDGVGARLGLSWGF